MLEYSDKHCLTLPSLGNYYKDERNNAANEIGAKHRFNNSETTASKSFGCKTNITERTPANNNTLDKEIVVLLKYSSNF